MKKKTKAFFIVLILLSVAAIAAIWFLYYQQSVDQLNTEEAISMKDTATVLEQKPGSDISQAAPIEFNKLYTENLSQEAGEEDADYYLLPSVSAKSIRVSVWLPDEPALNTSGVILGNPYYVQVSVYSGSTGAKIAGRDGVPENQGRTSVFNYPFTEELSEDESCVLKFERVRSIATPYYFMVGYDLSPAHACNYQETVYDNGARVEICQECGSIVFPDGGMQWIDGTGMITSILLIKTILMIGALLFVIFICLIALLVISPILRKKEEAARIAREKAIAASRPRTPRVLPINKYTPEVANATPEDWKVTVAHYYKQYADTVKKAEQDHGVSGVWNYYNVPSDLNYSDYYEVKKVLYTIDYDYKVANSCTKTVFGSSECFEAFGKLAQMEPLARIKYWMDEGLRASTVTVIHWPKSSSSSDDKADRDQQTISNLKNMSDYEVYSLANDPSASEEVRSAAGNENHWRTTNKWID